jgi:hypothetical protein
MHQDKPLQTIAIMRILFPSFHVVPFLLDDGGWEGEA